MNDLLANYPLAYRKNKRYNFPLYNKNYQRKIKMTVCIAAICKDGIIGISDRMVTTGDVEFEHSVSKIKPLTPNIIAMMAGDDSFQVEVLQFLDEVILNSKIEKIAVNTIVDSYILAKEYIENKKIQHNILRPLGISYDKLLTNDATLIKEDIRNFQRYNIPSTEIIIMGVDDKGPHIYTISKFSCDHINHINCHDRIGFTSIGIGARHATSQLMFTEYNPNCSFSESLLLIHNAKKRSEVAPGVGSNSDIVLVNNSGCITLKPKIVSDLDTIFKDNIKQEKNILLSAKEKVDTYVNNILKKND